jgi:hypothetical protein
MNYDECIMVNMFYDALIMVNVIVWWMHSYYAMIDACIII